MLSEPSASVMADSAATPVRTFRRETLFLEEFIPQSFLKLKCAYLLSDPQQARRLLKAENSPKLSSISQKQPKGTQIV